MAVCRRQLLLLPLLPARPVVATSGVSVASMALLVRKATAALAPAAEDCLRGENRIVQEFIPLPYVSWMMYLRLLHRWQAPEMPVQQHVR